MNPVQTLPHSLTVSELTKFLFALRAWRLYWVIPIEMILLACFLISTGMETTQMIIVLAMAPAITLLVSFVTLWLLARGKGAASARHERTYTFGANELHMQTANGQEMKVPYSSIHRVRPFSGGIIVEIAPRVGYWIHPKHFTDPDLFDQAVRMLGRHTP